MVALTFKIGLYIFGTSIQISFENNAFLSDIYVLENVVCLCFKILLLLLLYNIYIAHYITITLSASHYKTIKHYTRHQLI